MIDEGVGKDKMSVILNDYDSLQIIKIPLEKARPAQIFDLDLNGKFGQLID